MGSTFRFLGIDTDTDLVLGWFRSLPAPPEEIVLERDVSLYFRSFAPVSYRSPDTGREGPPHIEPTKSPLVSIFIPREIRGVLWTTGEVHFLATPLRKVSPQLEAVSIRFRKWLATFPLVFSGGRGWPGAWNSYLEGSIRNYGTDIRALPLAMQALSEGQYFVAEDETSGRLDIICRSLQLRGVRGIEA